MEFTVSYGKYSAITSIVPGNGGFTIWITVGARVESYTSKEAFTTDVVSSRGIKAFIEQYAPGLYSRWFTDAMAEARELLPRPGH